MKNTTHDQASSVLGNVDTSAHTQRKQIIALLNKHRSMHTPEFREHGIMAPAPRIFELRAEGENIRKVLKTYTDKTGKMHIGVAQYFISSIPLDNNGTLEDAA